MLRRTSSLQESLLRSSSWAAAAFVFGIFILIIGSMLWHGAGLLSWEFLTSEPLQSGRRGGIAPILVSTILILLVCMVTAVPLGLGTALLLSEYSSSKPSFGNFVRWCLDLLAGIPSIVFGLFGNAFFCKVLGLGFSILSGGLTLACMVLPILIRALEEGLRAIPQDYRRAAASLGLPRHATLWSILLPAAVPALMVGLILGLGRAIAETAALIFTSGYVDRMPESLMDSGRSLSVHIYDLSMNVSGGDKSAYASSLVLVALLFIINISASMLADRHLKSRLDLL